MPIHQVVILAVVQALTEFLPVTKVIASFESSSTAWSNDCRELKQSTKSLWS